MCILAIYHTHTHAQYPWATVSNGYPGRFAGKGVSECERGHFACIHCWTLRTLLPTDRQTEMLGQYFCWSAFHIFRIIEDGGDEGKVVPLLREAQYREGI